MGWQAPVTVATDSTVPASSRHSLASALQQRDHSLRNRNGANEICLHQTFRGINTRLTRRSVIHIRDPGVVDEDVIADPRLDSLRAPRTYAAKEANPIASYSGSLDSGPDMVLHRSDRPIQLCVASAGSCEDGSPQLD